MPAGWIEERHASTDNSFDYNRMKAVDDYRIQRGVVPSVGREDILQDIKTNISAFNRYGTILADDEASTSLGYVFMVRPDLNLISSDSNNLGELHRQTTANPFIAYMAKADPSLLLSLTHSIGSASHHFISLLYDRVDEYQITNFEIGTHEMTQPFTGYKTVYAGNGNGTLSSCQFEIGFRDTATLRVTKLFYLWVSYINGISLNLFAPKEEYLYSKYYQGSQVIDYATSIYFIRTRPDGEIIFFHKVTGAFPTSVPFNMQSYNRGSNPDPKISIQFVGGYPEAMNPVTIGEFNYNATGGTFRIKGIAPDYNPSGFGGLGYTGDTMVGAPVILERETETHGIKFYLCWQELNWYGNELPMPIM